MATAARRELPRRSKAHARRTTPLPAPGMAQSVAPRSRAVPRALPEWIRPQLTQLVKEAPEGDQWLHEIKYDGFRMHARLDRGEVRLLTRNGLNWTTKYPQIAAAVAALPARQAYLDGELCGVRPDGITSFSMVQLASDAGNAAGLVFFLFDLLYLDGEDLAARPNAKNGSRPCWRRRDRRCTTAITRSGSARPFTSKPVPSGSKGSSRNAPMPPTRPAIAGCGSRSNASTARNLW
jgi:ATP-dependent DNA ligase